MSVLILLYKICLLLFLTPPHIFPLLLLLLLFLLLGFQYNLSPFLTVSGHCLPVFCFHCILSPLHPHHSITCVVILLSLFLPFQLLQFILAFFQHVSPTRWHRWWGGSAPCLSLLAVWATELRGEDFLQDRVSNRVS